MLSILGDECQKWLITHIHDSVNKHTVRSVVPEIKEVRVPDYLINYSFLKGSFQILTIALFPTGFKGS